MTTLVIASFLVGAALHFVGLNPLEFWQSLVAGVTNFFTSIFGMGWEAVATIFSYIAFGAMIVVPIWLVAKLLSMRK
ncbi:MAG: DUF6460 domain-containing protein [bacterium]